MFIRKLFNLFLSVMIVASLFIGGNVSPALAAVPPAVSSTAGTYGFPDWYQDANGIRVQPCLAAADPNCIVLADPTFNPANPLVFPTNFPGEFFYFVADSDRITTPGCPSAGFPPLAKGAFMRVAMEGSFVTGAPIAGNQITFGRIRIVVKPGGLCPNTTYTFIHPYGTETITTHADGGVPANKSGFTEDIGCLAAPCDFSLALTSRVFGGFLQFDPAFNVPPAGYLGDAVTLSRVIGSPTGNNLFSITDGTGVIAQTNLFTVSGKKAGPLVASPPAVDFGGQTVGSPSAPMTITITNVDPVSITPAPAAITGANAADFAILNDLCSGVPLAQEQSCTISLAFTPSLEAVESAQLSVAHNGSFGSPLTVAITGTGTAAGAAPVVSLSTASLTFGNQRVRTSSAAQTVTVSNTGNAPLSASVAIGGANASQFAIASDSCSGAFVPAGASCAVSVKFAPTVAAASTASLVFTDNAADSPQSVSLSGTGTGGIAAVSTTLDPYGFPDWYQDENGVQVQPCIDVGNPNCILFPDATFDNVNPLSFPGPPLNFPGEYFYFVADSDKIETPGCPAAGLPPVAGGAFMRVAMESSFVTGAPVAGDQITFGRIRIVVKPGGLCPNTTYAFTHPYGTELITTHADGGVPANKSGFTEDIGCLAAPCDFSLALTSRVFEGFLRWDPAVTPLAPAGYLGDAVTLHPVIGSPNNIFKIADSTNTTVLASTNLFSVSGKLAGPLKANPADVTFPPTTVGNTSATTTVTITNAGISAVIVGTAAITGANAADFAIVTGGDLCSGQTLDATTPSCTIAISFTPTATGQRNGTLIVTHSGLNTPIAVGLHGLGQVLTPAISLTPAQLTFANQHTGTASVPQTVSIANSGGGADLHITSVSSDSANFTITGNTCDGTTLAPNTGSCTVDVSFTPTAVGALTGNLVVADDAPGNPHSVPLSGTGFAGAPAVSAAVDANHGFPLWYQDANGTRVEPCIEGADPNCILAGSGLNPALPTVWPTNFPSEFFYWIADSNPVNVDGGTILIRMALEGTTFGVAGDQLVFGRIKIKAVGVTPNSTYTFVHPFGGTDTLTTDAGGGGVLVQNIGCLAAPCDFSLALTSPVVNGFLQWDPRFGAAPAGHLGDALTPHRVVGAPFSVGGVPANFFRVMDSTGTNTLGETNLFIVAGRMTKPLMAAPASLAFSNQVVNTTSAAQNVVITNQSIVPQVITTAVSGDYAIGAGNTCTGSLASDATCTVPVTFTPTAIGPRAGLLTITSASGASISVPLSGIGVPPNQPPVAVNDSATTVVGTAVNIAVLANDSDPDGNLPLTVVNLTQPAHGTAVREADNTVTYTPAPDYIGSDSFTYQAADSLGALSNVATVAVTVNGFTTTTTISAPTITYNANGLVTVSVSSGAGTPTGNVSLSVDGGAAVSQALGAGGSTTFTLTSPAAGTHTLSASYTAQGNFAASSATGSLVVNRAATTTSINAPTVTYNANGSVTVTVSSAAGTPMGNVTLSVDGGAAVSQALGAGGSTTFTLTSPAAGTHTLAASYAAQGNFAASSATGTLTVNRAGTTTSISAPAVTAPANGLVTVTVTSPAGTVVGSVSLSVDGGAPITQTLFNGSTTFTLTSPSVGTHTLAASYPAQGNFLASSATGSLTVNPAPETITATATATRNKTRTAASWTINGTSSILTPHTITVRLTRTGALIGTATTDTRGRWKISVNNSPVVPVVGDTITVTTSLSSLTVIFPVTVK